MAERKSLSKKMRFEVFKRDKFTCQYCGRKAPDVILEVDHINPVSNDGENDILNLVTSCFDCNRGKGDRLISKSDELKKQQEKLEELSKKREQLEMLIEWRKELKSLSDLEVNMVVDSLSQYDVSLTEHGKETVKLWIKKYTLQRVLDSVDIAMEKYHNTQNMSREEAFSYIPRICYCDLMSEKDPALYYKNYLMKMLKNNFQYINERSARIYLNSIVYTDDDFEEMKIVIKNCRNWYEFKEYCEERKA